MKHCAILTMDCLDNFHTYDHLLDEPLLALGWRTEMVSWRRKDVDWNDFDVVVIRTPWDYQDDAPAFLQVLADIEASSARLENSLDIVRWNIDKTYLKALAEQGVHIVPTWWRDAGAAHFSRADFEQYFAYFNCDQLVIKPTVSANADNTFWLTRDNCAGMLAQLSALFSERTAMIQPFMASIIAEGEFSCFYFNGCYSHSILKTPKAQDFRVQEEHGGRLTSIVPEMALLEHGEQVLANLPELPLYARLDFVRDGERFALMEAELIEPSLYFNMDEQAASRFADAFVARLANSAM